MLVGTLSPPRCVCGAGGWWVRMSSLFWKTDLVCRILVERTSSSQTDFERCSADRTIRKQKGRKGVQRVCTIPLLLHVRSFLNFLFSSEVSWSLFSFPSLMLMTFLIKNKSQQCPFLGYKPSWYPVHSPLPRLHHCCCGLVPSPPTRSYFHSSRLPPIFFRPVAIMVLKTHTWPCHFPA